MIVGLVTQVRDGATLVCHANYEVMRELLGFMAEQCCADGTRPPLAIPRSA